MHDQPHANLATYCDSEANFKVTWLLHKAHKS